MRRAPASPRSSAAAATTSSSALIGAGEAVPAIGFSIWLDRIDGSEAKP